MRRVWLLSFFLVLAACTARDPRESPESAARALVEALERLHQSAYRAQAFSLLDAQSREVLEARARTAESLSHRPFTGADMFVPTAAGFAFKPGRIRDEDVVIDGDRARVTLRGDDPGEVATLELVRENDGWHVVLGLSRERDVPSPIVLSP